MLWSVWHRHAGPLGATFLASPGPGFSTVQVPSPLVSFPIWLQNAHLPANRVPSPVQQPPHSREGES